MTTTFSNYQLNAQFLYFSTICMLHYAPKHVSSSTLLILRRTNCITTASGIVTLCEQPYSMQVESGLQSALRTVCPALQSFSTFSHKRHDIRRKVTEHKMGFLIFSTTFVRNISHSKKKCSRYDKNVYWSSCKIPLILVRF